MLNGEEITSAYNYVNFINRIVKFDKRVSKANPREFTDFLIAESNTLVDFKFEKHLKMIKTKIEKTYEILGKQNLTDNEKRWLPILMSENAQAKSSKDIIKVIQKGLELTERFIR